MTPEQARQACIEKNKWVNDLKTPEGFTEVDAVKYENFIQRIYDLHNGDKEKAFEYMKKVINHLAEQN